MATAAKVYDFPMARVEDRLVSFLKTRRGESTVADMISGTGLPKYQVEQTAKVVLDEYAGRLRVTESGELLYYFPSGMRSTVRGFGPGLRRAWKSFARGAARVFSFLFKIWIVAMLVGYFAAFVSIGVLAIVASVAASAAGRGGRDDRRGDGGGLGGMYLALSLLDLLLRMWFWTSILGLNNQRRRPKEGRAFYKSVFGFVFGDGDPNEGWEEKERKHIISSIQGGKGVITLEELMAMTGREAEDANALMNRLLLEFEGEPGVTDNGTLIYTFPELMRTSRGAQASLGQARLQNGPTRQPVPFSANKPRTNGWIIFFNSFNLLFGTYFLVTSLTQGQAALAAKTGLYAFAGHMLQSAGINDPVGLLGIGLGAIPVLFSIVFFLVPLFRRMKLARQNEAIRTEALRKQVLGEVLASPALVDVSDIRSPGSGLEPGKFENAARRILERLAAQLKAEPVVREGTSTFAYKFAELERELADLEKYRGNVDVSRYDVGKTVFDSGT
ncbi:MAG TPA: hypothetical protein VMU36_05085 [Spirochaetia bacterium]|nr:hypothetical protein [Spirochaetia bacterium]